MKSDIHPDVTPTVFRCTNCGTPHEIRSALPQSELAVEYCAVCRHGIEPGRMKSTQIDKFRLRQARARKAQR